MFFFNILVRGFEIQDGDTENKLCKSLNSWSMSYFQHLQSHKKYFIPAGKNSK